jgi:hypothetical protein
MKREQWYYTKLSSRMQITLEYRITPRTSNIQSLDKKQLLPYFL